jgi:HAD superfamily phosphoserine phosphatase-like hydrolase
MCRSSDLLRGLNDDWALLKLQEKVKVKFVVAALDNVVNEESAKGYWGNRDIETVVDCGHVDVVKPRSNDDMSFLILKRFVGSLSAEFEPDKAIQLLKKYETKALRGVRGAVAPGSRYRVIGFDLDGTLLRGLDYSWQAVWDYLGFDPEFRKTGMRRYRHGQISYQEWCDWCKQQFRGKGLKRQDFAKIAATINVTKNLRPAIEALRNNGFILAIISGGIDVLLKEKIPDAEELFDYICINRVTFDDQHVIDGVDPTPFDFERKAVALEAICKRHGVTLKQSVFVGEGFNDSEVINKAELSIAYPPKERGIKEAATVSFEDDDLTKILKEVIL